jgi:hypothetical protein
MLILLLMLVMYNVNHGYNICNDNHRVKSNLQLFLNIIKTSGIDGKYFYWHLAWRCKHQPIASGVPNVENHMTQRISDRKLACVTIILEKCQQKSRKSPDYHQKGCGFAKNTWLI